MSCVCERLRACSFMSAVHLEFQNNWYEIERKREYRFTFNNASVHSSFDQLSIHFNISQNNKTADRLKYVLVLLFKSHNALSGDAGLIVSANTFINMARDSLNSLYAPDRIALIVEYGPEK